MLHISLLLVSSWYEVALYPGQRFSIQEEELQETSPARFVFLGKHPRTKVVETKQAIIALLKFKDIYTNSL